MSIKHPETCRRTRKNDTRAGGTTKNMQVHVHLRHLHFVCCHLDWKYWREASKSNLAPSPAGEWTLYGGAATVQSLGSRARSEVSWPHVRVSRGPERSHPVEERVRILPRAVQVSAGQTAQLRWNRKWNMRVNIELHLRPSSDPNRLNHQPTTEPLLRICDHNSTRSSQLL